MILRFRFPPLGERERRRAEHVLRTIASLLEVPWEIEPQPASDRQAGIAVDLVSEGAVTPAARIACSGWAPWQAASLRATPFRGSWLLHPAEVLPGDAREDEFPEAWLRGAGFLLHREEELAETRRDQWGCFAAPYSCLAQLGLLGQPLLNQYAVQLETVLRKCARAGGIELPRVERWKEGAPYAAVLSHDVDDVRRYSVRQALRLLARNPKPGSYAQRAGLRQLAQGLAERARARDPYSQFARWLDTEFRHGFRSTWFVQVEPRRSHEFDATYRLHDPVHFRGKTVRVGDLFRALAETGSEVALHASYQTHEDGEAMRLEREQLERVVPVPCWGNRQHFLRFEAGTSWGHLERAGFRYDSTLGYNEDVGFRAGIAAPFRPWNPQSDHPATLWEVPLAVMDGALFRGLGLSPAEAWERVLTLLEEVRSCGGLLVCLWHPNGADEQHFPGWWALYEQLLARLDETGAWVAPARTVVEWWEQRAETLGKGEDS